MSFGPSPNFKNLGRFKGAASVGALEAVTIATLERYCSLPTTLEMRSTYRLGIRTDAVAEAEKVCRRVMDEFPIVTFVAGKVVFVCEKRFQRFLHNETAAAIQKRLYWMGATMVVLPEKVT